MALFLGISDAAVPAGQTIRFVVAGEVSLDIAMVLVMMAQLSAAFSTSRGAFAVNAVFNFAHDFLRLWLAARHPV
jgi:hypothetical protein